jgi:LacI family transcriptional regulator
VAKLTEIANKVGVSKTSVSTYLKDKNTNRLSESTKNKIEKAIKELNYRPNVIARSLSSNKTNTVSVIIPYNGPLFRSSFVNEVLSGIQFELFRNGYSIIFLPTRGEDSPAMVKHHVEAAHGYDGVILFGTRYCTLDALHHNVNELINAGTPFAAVNMPELSQDFNQVILRTPQESNPVRYLLKTGHRDILLVIGREADPESIETLEMYKKILSEWKIPFRSELVLYGDFERDVSRSAVIKAVKQGITFSAVYALSDTMAIGVYEACKENGLSIPAGISVIGTNDAFFAPNMDPPLTTLRKQVYRAGEEAAKSLLYSIETNKTGRKIYLNNELILRSSSQVHPNIGA